MKIIFSFLFLVAFFIIKMPAQQVPFPERGKVRVITTPRGDNRFKQKPAEGAESHKVLTEELLKDTFFNLFIKEYSDGKEIDNAHDLIFANPYTKGTKIILEIIPDIEDDKHLRLFTYFPGFESFTQKLSSENTHFKNAFFEKSIKNEYDKKIPISLIYEEKDLDNSKEKIVNKYQKDGVLLDNQNMDENLYPHLNRYFIVYYVLTEIKN